MPNFKKNPNGMNPNAFTMKNSMLHMSAKTGSPMQANYSSPMRDETKTKKTLGEWFRGTTLGQEISKAGKALQSDVSKVKTKVEKGVSKVSEDFTKATKKVQGVTQAIGDKIAGDIKTLKKTDVPKQFIKDVKSKVSKAKSSYADYKANKKAGESRWDYNIRKKREATGALAPK